MTNIHSLFLEPLSFHMLLLHIVQPTRMRNTSKALTDPNPTGFSTDVENIRGLGGGRGVGGGSLQNFMGGLKSVHGGEHGGLKCCQKIPVKEFI